MLGVAPIRPSRDLEATTAFYARLGFERKGLLHFFFAPDTDPFASVAGCYLYVEDADALFAEFQRLGLPDSGIPRLHGAPQDSDGNLLRIGSLIESPAAQPG